jgi:hypothetical protein
VFVSHSAQYLERKWVKLLLSQEGSSPAKPDGLTCSLGAELPRQGGLRAHRMFCEPEYSIESPSIGGHLVRAGLKQGIECTRNVMKAGLLSQVVMVGGEVLFISLLLIVVAALTRGM